MENKPKSLFGSPDTSRSKPLFEAAYEQAASNTGASPLFAGAKIRKRIDVTVDQLRKFGADLPILEASRQQILMTNVDELCLKYVLDWGSHLQMDHTRFLEVMMDLSNSSIMNNTKKRIGSIITQLQDLDLTKLKKDTWFKSKEKRMAEMNDSLRLLLDEVKTGFNIDTLLQGHSLVEQLKKNLIELQKKIDPYVITCSFFSEYEKDGFPKELYITRLTSLLSTKNSINNDLTTVEFMAKTWITVIELVNSIIRNELPMWCSNFASVLAGSVADLDSLQKNKDNFITKLTKVTE